MLATIPLLHLFVEEVRQAPGNRQHVAIRQVVIRWDNEAAFRCINRQRATSFPMRTALSIFTEQCKSLKLRVRAEHISTNCNHIADALSRIKESHKEAVGMLNDRDAVHVSPPNLWPNWEQKVVAAGKRSKANSKCRHPETSGKQAGQKEQHDENTDVESQDDASGYDSDNLVTGVGTQPWNKEDKDWK